MSNTDDDCENAAPPEGENAGESGPVPGRGGDSGEGAAPETEPADDAAEIDAILREAERSADSDAEVDALKREIEAGKDRYLRLMAEFDNYKKRSLREYERLAESASEKLILELVDVRENFSRALKSGEAGGEFAPFFDGMRMIFAKFDDTLGKNGLSVFAEAGEPFDPNVHDALMNAPHAEIPAGHVAQVFERGYRLKDRVIKHARVIVSSGAPDETVK